MSELRLNTDVKTGEPVKKELTDEENLIKVPYVSIPEEENIKEGPHISIQAEDNKKEKQDKKEETR